MVEKISHYFTWSKGLIRIVIVIQLIRQHPPLKPKRKRRLSSIGDKSDARRRTPPPVAIAAEAANDPVSEAEGSDPVLPQLLPPGRLIQGHYWVYNHGLNVAGKQVIQCPIERQVSFSSPCHAQSCLSANVYRSSIPPRQLASSRLPGLISSTTSRLTLTLSPLTFPSPFYMTDFGR